MDYKPWANTNDEPLDLARCRAQIYISGRESWRNIQCSRRPASNDSNGYCSQHSLSFCEVNLSSGKVAKVSAIDYLSVVNFKWSYQAVTRPTIENATGYAYRFRKLGLKRQKIYLHRFIAERMGALEDGVWIDHENGDGLDCTRGNLRAALPWENKANARNYVAGKKYIGVFTAPSGRFVAQIKLEGKTIHLGTFDTDEEAAIMRDRAARERFGQFAVLNFPEGEPF